MIATTSRPFKPLFRCDFTEACFASGQLEITNGSDFNPSSLSVSTKPPQAPTSDVTSISEYSFSFASTVIYMSTNIIGTVTSNNEMCKLPFRPQLENSTDVTNWDMWFCYNDQCPTTSTTSGMCASGTFFFEIKKLIIKDNFH
jgi:hypothetical protein